MIVSFVDEHGRETVRKFSHVTVEGRFINCYEPEDDGEECSFMSQLSITTDFRASTWNMYTGTGDAMVRVKTIHICSS